MKTSKIKQAIIQTYMVKEIELSELDMENRGLILGKDWDDEKKEWPYTISKVAKNAENEYSFRGEADPVNIEVLINTLKKLKNKGCNFVEIMNHSDHHGYHINGLEIRKASPRDMSEYEQEEFERKKTLAMEHIKRCEKEIAEARKKISTK